MSCLLFLISLLGLPWRNLDVLWWLQTSGEGMERRLLLPTYGLRHLIWQHVGCVEEVSVYRVVDFPHFHFSIP